MESRPGKSKANDWKISGNLITTVQKPNNHAKYGTDKSNRVKETTPQ
jgi:hypothetical protein